VVGNIGEITPKALTSVSLTGSVSKVYDGTATVANLGTANYSIAGFIGGEGATITNTTGQLRQRRRRGGQPGGQRGDLGGAGGRRLHGQRRHHAEQLHADHRAGGRQHRRDHAQGADLGEPDRQREQGL
jgi:hypothetical protein